MCVGVLRYSADEERWLLWEARQEGKKDGKRAVANWKQNADL
jgi:hypothetical protein